MQKVEIARKRNLLVSFKESSGKSVKIKEPFKEMKVSKRAVRVATVDIPSLIETRIKKLSDNSFIYLTYAYSTASEFFSYYDLIEIPYSKVNKLSFFTMSAHGVTYWSREDRLFTRLDEWLFDYKNYCKIIEIKTFKKYHLWKAFKVWRTTILWKKFSYALNYLEENLFVCDKTFNKVIVKMREEYTHIVKLKFSNITELENWNLFYFVEAQMAQYEQTRDLLKNFKERMSKILYNACHKSMLNKGYSIQDEMINCKSIRRLKDTFGYSQRKLKKKYCVRLTRFVNYIDLITMTMLHQILQNSLEDLARVFQIHNDLGPSIERLEMILEEVVELELPRPEGSPQSPFISAQLVLKPEQVEVDPSFDVTSYIVGQVVNLIVEATQNLERFQLDDNFNFFTEPSIMGKSQGRLFEEPLNIKLILDGDSALQSNKDSIFKNINIAYDKVELYVKRFDDIRDNYRLDVTIDKELLKKEKDLDVLISSCKRFTNEMLGLDNIPMSVNLGLLKLKQGTFKAEIIPTCKELLAILEVNLPRIAKETVKDVIFKAENVLTKLITPPDDTKKIVQYLYYIDRCPEIIQKIEDQLDYALRTFLIMKDYEIEVTDEDKEGYMDMEDLMKVLNEVLVQKTESRQAFIEELDVSLQKDIEEIFREVEEVREEIGKDWLIDESSDRAQIREVLAELIERLYNAQSLSQEYGVYQKEFKIEITRFDTLDAVLQEVKIRQTLWDSVQHWKDVCEEWNDTLFKQLNVEQIIEANTKILRDCAIMDKTLPKNEVVAKLKLEAEEFREKIPVLQALRSPDLKTRHWLKLESILDRKLAHVENLSLYTFEDANAFEENIAKALLEVSGQASGESRLEDSLKKVDAMWKDLDLICVQHRDSRDTFVVEGTEDIQAVLDESNVSISTIAASRHLGPLKSKIDDWIAKLSLFEKTWEEFLACQASWKYLEAIFSAPDIQRQLPHEAKIFQGVDKNWKALMRDIQKYPLAMPIMTTPGIYETMLTNNTFLEQVKRCMEAYIEVKRVIFPRFYFLSNDELLEILAQTKNPHAVQPHLKKCFDMVKLEFGTKPAEKKGEKEDTNDIVAMISEEGERVQFGRGLKARGSVEDWLSKVEDAMHTALKRCMKFALLKYSTTPRRTWFQEHPSQISLTVSQQQWALAVHAILDEPSGTLQKSKMKELEQKSQRDLAELASVARSEIPFLVRKILGALITVDVHAKDTITHMIKMGVSKTNDFEWQKMLRYYWHKDTETMKVSMASANMKYFYEYLGASGVLVITPLTDRCFLCLMAAMQMNLGGAPSGPAGTGKTETIKDLAKALAIRCEVFNCSDGLDYKMMGQLFSGLVQCGSLCCFDEFNRIDIEVLSVIAQQLVTIRNAKVMKFSQFLFEGREIKILPSCATFITMNPGYAGRTELPDNLKSLFRPMSMIVPDYGLIAEVILYSEGFEESKLLAQKMVQMYKLCSEQLSQQDHYDFGMRAVKSVLVMAGALKRKSPLQREDLTLICALRDSNLPKFLFDDAILFQNILSDLFPGVELPTIVKEDLKLAIEQSCDRHNFQKVEKMIHRTLQLYETMVVRWGVMLVGATGIGKTSILHTLADALSRLHEDKIDGPFYRPVVVQSLNPKAVSMDELYGAVNQTTMEWKDGLLGFAIRKASIETEEIHQWVVCDGPVDALWMENLNTVLDDNKMLCLANSERIKLTPWMHLIFEVQDLSQASPATVSRCGMVYVDQKDLGWSPLVKSWLQKIPERILNPELKEFILLLFKTHLDAIFGFAAKECKYLIHQVEASKVDMICTLLETLLMCEKVNVMEREDVKVYLTKLWIWSTLWSVGCNFLDDSRVKLETNIVERFKEDASLVFPPNSLWLNKINYSTKDWEDWESSIPAFIYSPTIPFFEMLVPTSDTVRLSYLAELLLNANHPVMFTGETGVGKSVIMRALLSKLSQETAIPVVINFSAKTSSARTQETIEARLEKRKRTLLGAPINKKIIYFVDDVNMTKLDLYGSQPPIEMLRQLLDLKGLYDCKKLYWKDVADVVLSAACAPPSGGRNKLSPRFVRHFALLSLPTPNTETLTTIFRAIVGGFFNNFARVIQTLCDPIVFAAVSVYNRMKEDLLPTPAKSHYLFNLRDLSKCVQGILQADPLNNASTTQMLRIFYHESMRVFHDRLINDEDKKHFKDLMEEICMKYFNSPIVGEEEEFLLFGDFMTFGQPSESRVYEEIKDHVKLKTVLMEYLNDYNITTGKDMKLILFHDAIEHIIRLARLLRTQRGNGLLVGVSGMGKQSLSRLASHLNGYQCVQIELHRQYDHSSFLDDLRKYYISAGIYNNPTVFLINDSQIIMEEFLEDINNILNSGEVPNLFEGDEYEKVILNSRQAALEFNLKEQTRLEIWDFFISRVRSNLHVILSLSPVGENFRRNCRMFPSLVNCCTIDWFVKWPQEALFSVAFGSLMSIAEDEKQCENLSTICVLIHETVEATSEQYFEETQRHYYTTPSSYLELLKQYHYLLKMRSEEISAKRDKIANGLTKLLETNENVAIMEDECLRLVPTIEEKQKQLKELTFRMEKDSATVELVKSAVAKDEMEAKLKAQETQELADDASKDLEVVMPNFRAAQEALKSLSKVDINEIKVFQKPPKLVQFVMDSVCILMGVSKPDWNASKQLLSDINFLKKLQEYDVNHIPEALLKRIKPYVDHKDFDPAIVEKVSKVAKSMCQWVGAVDKYAKVYRDVEPKIIKRDNAENDLRKVLTILKQKQNELAEIEAKIEKLKKALEEKQLEMQEVQDRFDLTNARLNRAGRLTSALSDEEIRWRENVQDLTIKLNAIPGDVLVAAACVAYLGAFSLDYRKHLTKVWVNECKNLDIPSSLEFDLVHCLGDPFQIREWNVQNLPRDQVSIENGIMVTQASRWPLMIDPQEQANLWIRKMEKKNNLIVSKMNDPNLARVLEQAIRQGTPVLLEDLQETIDPSLNPILAKSISLVNGKLMIKLGDQDVDYDQNFKLYMTTKLSNPHYLPEICIRVTLVNFLVTLSGLEDQLLADVVRIELPDIEKQRNDLILNINSDKHQLLFLEDKILKLLFAAQGNILDDEELVEVLNESKETSCVITARLSEAEKTELIIIEERDKYRPLATRGAILFFVVVSLADIDRMYQFSLRYFSQVFCGVIQVKTSNISVEFEDRLEYLMAKETLAIYTNISRGLFEKHKLIFSFLVATAIEKQSLNISNLEYEFLLRGPVGFKSSLPKPETLRYLSDNQWLSCQYLSENIEGFEVMLVAIEKKVHVRIDDFSEDISVVLNAENPDKDFCQTLRPFQKIMLVSVLRIELLIKAVGAYIRETIGTDYTDPQNNSLHEIFPETSNATPLVFVLSTGSDPMAAVERFAVEKDFHEKLYSISLGQGQGPAAEGLIENGRTYGYWIFLQNCHLSTSWMPQLEKIVRDITLGTLVTNADFRLFLTSMPAKTFPISVLQNSVKLTNEPPKGLRANLKIALNDLNEDHFEIHILRNNWRAMVFGLCMFHAVILERRKFGSLGWNKPYQFSEGDRNCALGTLETFCDREVRKDIQWDALEYLNGEITYGGRITDDWDQRCLRSILKVFSSPQILQENYSYSESGRYKCPQSKFLKDFKDYVDQLPYYEPPEIFGLHENANLVFETKEANNFLSALIKQQPRGNESSDGTISENICLEMLVGIRTALLKSINLENIKPELQTYDSKGRTQSLTTVLLQEVNSFNKLLRYIHESLNDLENAIKGIIVMSEYLEKMFNSFLNNQVPHCWAKRGYLSVKSLSSWVTDLEQRIEFIQSWLERGLPRSFWIGGLFYPQAFLTGTLQNHARKHNFPIDSLKFDFEVLPLMVTQKEIYDRRSLEAQESSELYNGIDFPEDGIIIHGIFIEAGRWNTNEGGLCDALLRELTPNLPALWLKPSTNVEVGHRYLAPLYKTGLRAGILSTTGHSTNFLLPVLLESRKPPSFWILRGTALITMITDK